MDAKRLETTVDRSYQLRYLLQRPSEADRPLPLVIFLHGAGERGDDLDLVTAHGPARQAAEGRDLPFLLAAPQCPADSWWSWQAEAVIALLDRLLAEEPVDPDRVYLTGLSMGGYGTWDIGGRFTERFAALVPICGGGPFWAARRLASIPVWAFHNADDPVVPVSQTERMISALEEAGGRPRSTISPTGGHDAWTAAYDDPQLYDWLLRQRRSGPVDNAVVAG